MTRKRVVLVCSDEDRASAVRGVLESPGLFPFDRVEGGGGFPDDEPDGRHALTIRHLHGDQGLAGVDAVLLAESRSRRPAPVVVLAGRYDAAEALTLFRMGVSDYLGLREHAGALPGLVERWLGGPRRDSVRVVPGAARTQAPAPARGRQGSRP